VRKRKRDKADLLALERPLLAIFFLFGLSVMSWVPRFPEVKANLRLSNGEFGTIISFGALGGLISLFTVGHLVNQYGTRYFLYLSSFGFCCSIAFIVHQHNKFLFLIFNMTSGICVAAFNISINAQSLSAQKRLQKLLLPRTAGVWSAGALTGIALNGLIITRVSLTWHIDVLQVICFLGMAYFLYQISPHLVTPTTARNNLRGTLKQIRKFKIDWFFCFVMLLAIQMEFSMGDWATIYSRENLHSSPESAAYPYLSFLAAMIFGRLAIHKFTKIYSPSKLLRFGAVLGGSGYLIGIFLSNTFVETSPHTAFLSMIIGLGFGGLGSSFMGPFFTNAAQQKSNESNAVVIGQLGVMNNLMVLVMKAIIAWVAQWLGLHVALLIPGLMLLMIFFFSKEIEIEKRSTSNR
jgi:MFS family permease